MSVRNFKLTFLINNLKSNMKKRILTLYVSAIFGGVFIFSSCNNPSQTNQSQVEEPVEIIEDKIEESEEQSGIVEEETIPKPVETEDEISEEDPIMDDLKSDVDKIEEKGNAFVKTIQDGLPADDIRGAQDDFQAAISDAHESYQKAIQAGKTGDDLTEIQQRMEITIQDAQARAQQAMNERS